MVFMFILIFGIIGLTAWNVRERQKNEPEEAQHQVSEECYTPGSLSEGCYAPGSLMVTFKDGTNFDDAMALVKSYDLIVEPPDNPEINRDSFTPKSYRAIKAESFAQIDAKLKNYSEVVEFNDETSNPANNRAGKGEKWVEVIWGQDVLYSRIKDILVEAGLGAPTQPQGTLRSLFVKVPIGKEDFYAGKLKQNSTVENATRFGRPVTQ